MPLTPGLVLVLLQGCADRYAAEGRPLQLAFCVIPDRGNSTYLYPAIKRWANTGGGVPSQCVQAGKLLDRQKFGVTYVSNLLLKLNLKLGGQNVHPSPTGCSYAAPPRTGSSTPGPADPPRSLPCLRPNKLPLTRARAPTTREPNRLVQATPTIVFGADVYHAPPGTDRPSFAAVCASMDRNLATYHTLVDSQPSRCARGRCRPSGPLGDVRVCLSHSGVPPLPPPTPPCRCEVVDQMEGLVVQQLRRFYELNGQLAPRRIIFYRDGIGNSQFPIIKQREIAAIRRACAIVGGDHYTPELVFIVVQVMAAPYPPHPPQALLRTASILHPCLFDPLSPLT